VDIVEKLGEEEEGGNDERESVQNPSIKQLKN